MEKVTITREDLYQNVWSTPLTQLAKEYKIPDARLKEKCLKNNIPLPQVGHWSKIRHGKIIKKTPLPPTTEDKPIVLCLRDHHGVAHDPAMDDRTKIKNEIESQFKKFLIPTVKLIKPHSLISNVQNHLLEKKANREGYISSDSNQYLSITVSKQKIPVAIRIFNSFIHLAEARGHFVFVKHQKTIISIDGIEIKVDVRERQKKVDDDSFPYYSTHYINIPSGILCFRVGDYDKREWDDKKRNIESQFPRIFAMLEIFASERKRWRIEAEKQQVQQEKERHIRLEQYRSKLQEFKNIEKLIQDSNRWNRAKIIRRYADNLEAMGKEKEEVEWIRNKADWIDPTTGKHDLILGEYSDEPPKSPSYW